MGVAEANRLEAELRRHYQDYTAGTITKEVFATNATTALNAVDNDVLSLQDQADALYAATDGTYKNITAKGTDGEEKTFTGRPKPPTPKPLSQDPRPIIGFPASPGERVYPQGFKPLPGSSRVYPQGFTPSPGSGSGFRP